MDGKVHRAQGETWGSGHHLNSNISIISLRQHADNLLIFHILNLMLNTIPHFLQAHLPILLMVGFLAYSLSCLRAGVSG